MSWVFFFIFTTTAVELDSARLKFVSVGSIYGANLLVTVTKSHARTAVFSSVRPLCCLGVRAEKHSVAEEVDLEANSREKCGYE